MPTRFKTVLFSLLLVLAIAYPPHGASAQSISPGDIIAAVNQLRASRGLPPYKVDSGLMAYAQEHSEYQASTGVSTHQHSDGSTPSSRGVTENLAAGSSGYLSVDFVVSQIWSDAIHMNTMVGYATGSIGAGVADNGTDTYVTIDVRGGGSAGAASPGGAAAGAAGNNAVATPIALTPLATVTPRADGSVVHQVGYGQSLWSIALAYGVQIIEIRGLNSMPEDSNDIYAGQKLLIRPPGSVITTAITASTGISSSLGISASLSLTPTETLEPTLTPTRRATRTPRRLSTTPAPTRTSAPSTAAVKAEIFRIAWPPDTRTLGLALVVFGGIGLVALLLTAFRK